MAEPLGLETKRYVPVRIGKRTVWQLVKYNAPNAKLEIRRMTKQDYEGVSPTERWRAAKPLTRDKTKGLPTTWGALVSSIGAGWYEKRSFLASFCHEYFLDRDAANNVSKELTNLLIVVGYALEKENHNGAEIEYQEPVVFAAIANKNIPGIAPELIYLCTHPFHHNEGYGSAMLKYYENYVVLRASGPTEIRVNAFNTESTRRFYEKNGYGYLVSQDLPPAIPQDKVLARIAKLPGKDPKKTAYVEWKETAEAEWAKRTGRLREIPGTVLMHKQVEVADNQDVQARFRRAEASRQEAWLASALEKLSLHRGQQ